MNPAVLGFIRGIGVVVIAAALAYVGDVSHLVFLSPTVATVIAALALSLENYIEGKNGNALFGAVKTRK